MSKNNKIALKVSAGISFFMAFVAIFAALCLAFNWFDIQQVYNEIIFNVLGERITLWRTTYKYFVVFEGLFSAIINCYVGYVYFKISKVNGVPLGVNKLLTYLAFIQLFFTASFLSAIIAMFVAGNITRTLNGKTSEHKVDDMEVLVVKINNLKELKKQGKISEQEYEQKFNELLEAKVKNDTKEV